MAIILELKMSATETTPDCKWTLRSYFMTDHCHMFLEFGFGGKAIED